MAPSEFSSARFASLKGNVSLYILEDDNLQKNTVQHDQKVSLESIIRQSERNDSKIRICSLRITLND